MKFWGRRDGIGLRKRWTAIALSLSLLAGIAPPAGQASPPPGGGDLLLAAHAEADSYYQPRISRDGSTVVYLSRAAGEEGVYVYDATAGLYHRLDGSVTPDPDRGLAVSGTGRFVAFEAADETASGRYVLRLHDRWTGETERLAGSEGRFRSLSISEDGDRLAFVTEGADLIDGDTNGVDDVYLLDRQDEERPIKRISVNYDGEQTTLPSSEPMVSADGGSVVFVSSAPELQPGRDEQRSRVYNYYTDSGYLDHLAVLENEVEELNVYSPSISHDGSYIAVREMDGSRGVGLFLYDWLYGEFHRVWTVTGATYLSLGPPSVADDGSFIALDYAYERFTPEQAEPPFPVPYGAIRIDPASGAYAPMGDPTAHTRGLRISGDGSRSVYLTGEGGGAGGNRLYLSCADGCAEPSPNGPIADARWSAEDGDLLAGYLKPGRAMRIRAVGDPGASLRAEIAYLEADPDRQDGTIARQSVLPMTESATPGAYFAEFPFADGIVEVSGVRVATVDGVSGLDVPDLPLTAAGRLELEVEAEPEDPSRLEGAYFVLSGGGMPEVYEDWRSEQDRYTLFGIPDAELALELRHADGTGVLARHAGLVLAAGRRTTLTVTPAFQAELRVHVYRSDTFEPVPGANVLFREAAGGAVLAEVAADANGVAALPSARTEGERIEVQVAASGYTAPGPQTATLTFGLNELAFALRPLSSDVRSVETTFSRQVGGAPVIGSEARLAVAAGPGLAVQARVHLSRWADGEPHPAASTVALTLDEIAPGRYEAAFAVEEGMASLDTLELRLGDEWLPVSYPIGKTVAPRLRVQLEMPDGEPWNGALARGGIGISYVDPELGIHYSDYAALPPGSFEATVDVPYAHAEHRYRLNLSGSGASGAAEAAAVRAGAVHTVRLTPQFAVTFDARVLNETGAPVKTAYTLRDEEGRIVGEGVSASNQANRSKLSVGAGQRLKLLLQPQDPDYEAQELDVVADRLVIAETYRLGRKATGTWSGWVRRADGQPAAGARVDATVVDGPLSKRYTAFADRDGRYSLALPAGYTAEARAAGSGAEAAMISPMHRQRVEGNAALDFTVLEGAELDFKLYVRNVNGQWEEPLALDWLELDRYGISFSRPIVRLGPPIQLLAVPGETVQVCVGQSHLHMKDCSETTIGPDNRAELEMRLEDRRALADFRPVRLDGTVLPQVFARIVGTGGEASGITLLEYFGDGSAVTLPRPGSYRMVVTEPGPTRADQLVTQVEFTVAAGQRIDLGTVRLQPSGKFSGADNRIFVSSDDATPDGFVELHARYVNNGTPRERAEQASLVFELPAQAEFIDRSAVVDGQAASAQVEGQRVVLPLDSVEPMQRGSARIQVRLAPEPMLAGVAVHGSIRYRLSGQEREDPLGAAYIELHPVTLRAPERTAQLQFQVSGQAPPGEQVTVYEGAELLGRAQASPIGTWYLNVSLADNGTTNRRLRTETTLQGKVYGGQSAIVRHTPDEPVLQEMTFELLGGSAKTFYPSDGVALFPYVTTFGNNPYYSMKFSHPDHVYNVRVRNGTTLADASRAGDRFVLETLPPRNLGPISVSYETRSSADERHAEPPTREQARNLAPPPLADAELLWVARAGEWTPNGRLVPEDSQEMMLKLTDDTWSNVRISRTDAPDYEPTAQDLRLEALTGRSVYGMSVSHSPRNGRAEVSFTMYVPEVQGTSGPGGMLQKSGGASLAGGMTKVTFDAALRAANNGTKAYDSWENAQALLKPSDLDKIDGLIQQIQALECIEDFARSRLMSNANAARFTAIQHEMAKQMLNVIGGFGEMNPLASLIFWGETKWAGKELDRIMEEEIRDLENNIKAYVCMKKPPDEKRVADPSYIYDPSGFVYEGLPSNVLEGVTATVFRLDSDTGRWELWDAEWYEQINPQLTNGEGRYGWDVPPGWWQVKYEKEGYETAYSEELEVLPPHFDVNIPLVSYLPPEVTAVKPLPGGAEVEFRFSKPMAVASMTDGAVVVQGPDGAVAGSLHPKDPGEGADGQLLAFGLRFVPDTPLTADTEYVITAGASLLRSYAGVPLAAPYTAAFTVVAVDTMPPGPVADARGAMEGDRAALRWRAPADVDENGVLLRWRLRGEPEFGDPVAVEQGKRWTIVEGLQPGRAYEFSIAAVDESGNRSADVRVVLAEDEEREDFLPPPAPEQLSVEAAGSGGLLVRWQDPAADDLAKLTVRWQIEDRPETLRSADVAPGAQRYAISGLTAATRYRVAVFGVDEAGNRSAEVYTTAVTRSGSDTGGGSGGGPGPGSGGSGGPGGPAAEPNGGDSTGAAAQGHWEVGPEGGRFEARDGLVRVTVPAGTFMEGGRLRWLERAASDVSAPDAAGYTRVSPAFAFDADGWNAGRAIRLVLAYDEALLAGRDARRLGIYRKDASSLTGWRYVGGFAEAAGGKAEAGAWISRPGEYAVMLYERVFADMSGHWGREAAEVLAGRHLVEGTGQGQFEPDRAVTRAEAAKLLVELVRVYGSPIAAAGEEPKFGDVEAGAWYGVYVNEAARLGLMHGADGRFRPSEAISREELAVVLARLADRLALAPRNASSEGGALDRFADASDVSDWAAAAMETAVERGWMRGDASRLFPRHGATRAETAALLLRIMTDLDRAALE